jgi:hypothetical protein
MKVYAALTLASIAQARILGRADRRILKSLATESISGDESISVSIKTAMIAYLKDFEVPVEVPDWMGDFLDHQTGRTECDTDANGECAAGFMDLSPLWGYGCWCFLGNVESTLGRGPPIDSFDTVCKGLTTCYRCITNDAEQDDRHCDPYTVEFDASLQVSGQIGQLANITATCQTKNQDECAWQTCSCAMTMVSGFFNLSFAGSEGFDPNLQHKNGFDYALECPQQGVATDRQCCGFYPSRRTYDRSEYRDCCHNKSIFNPLRHQCCDDGSYVGLGGRCE